MILITGSSGFIGQALIERLSTNFQVIGLARRKPEKSPKSVIYLTMDLENQESIADTLRHVHKISGGRLESVVHLAAYHDFSGKSDPRYDSITVNGTATLLKTLKNLRFNVEQFIFSSTMLVHAPCRSNERINEDWPVNPRWPYPKSKARTENLLRSLHEDIPLAVLRIAGVYDDRCHSVPLAHQIHHIYEDWLLSHFFPGDTSHGQAFVHLSDVLEAISLTIQKMSELPNQFTALIGEDETLSYAEIQDIIGQNLHGRKWQTTRIPKLVAEVGARTRQLLPLPKEPLIQPGVIPFADDHYSLDISRARQELSWIPKRSLRNVLPQIVQYLKEDPETFYRENKLPWTKKKV